MSIDLVFVPITGSGEELCILNFQVFLNFFVFHSKSSTIINRRVRIVYHIKVHAVVIRTALNLFVKVLRKTDEVFDI